MNFTLDGGKEQYKYFSKDGDFEDGYDVLLWRDSTVKTIGTFNVHTRQVNIVTSDIAWNVGPNNTVSADSNPPRKQYIAHFFNLNVSKIMNNQLVIG